MTKPAIDQATAQKLADEYGVPLGANGLPDFDNATFEVFNPTRRVGVRSGYRDGVTLGIYLADSCSSVPEATIAKEIVQVARVAAIRGLLAIRHKLECTARINGQPVDLESVSGMPTIEDYQLAYRNLSN